MTSVYHRKKYIKLNYKSAYDEETINIDKWRYELRHQRSRRPGKTRNISPETCVQNPMLERPSQEAYFGQYMKNKWYHTKIQKMFQYVKSLKKNIYIYKLQCEMI